MAHRVELIIKTRDLYLCINPGIGEYFFSSSGSCIYSGGWGLFSREIGSICFNKGSFMLFF